MKPVPVAPLALLAVLALSGCPEQLGDLCPKPSVPLGQFGLVLKQQTPSDACFYSVATDGGGFADAGLVGSNVQGASIELCVGTGADGGLQLLLAAPGKASRTSDVSDAGAFAFETDSDVAPGASPCTCGIHVSETISGVLTGPFTNFALQPDGGLPDISGIDGGLVDKLATDAGPLPDGGSSCTCNLPCEAAYTAQGRRQ